MVLHNYYIFTSIPKFQYFENSCSIVCGVGRYIKEYNMKFHIGIDYSLVKTKNIEKLQTHESREWKILNDRNRIMVVGQ